MKVQELGKHSMYLVKATQNVFPDYLHYIVFRLKENVDCILAASFDVKAYFVENLHIFGTTVKDF